MVEFPKELKARVKERLKIHKVWNLGRTVWVQQDNLGNWYVHSDPGPLAEQKMSECRAKGRFVALAAEVLK